MAGNDSKMWVIATKRGYLGDEIRKTKKEGGKPFEIDRKQFSETWMKKVAAPAVAKDDEDE